MSKWISIKNKKPLLHDLVLLYMTIDDESEGSNFCVGYRESDDNYYFNNYGESIEAISSEYFTHWMKLPKSPQESI
jgi:hypothetical protein